MMRRPPRSHRTDTLLPYTTPFRSIFFAVHYERDFTLFVTTDRDQDSPERPPAASDEEIRYLCDAANQYFAQSIGPEDVVWSYAGVRPLVDDGSGKPEAATRGYRLAPDGGAGEAVLLLVLGGDRKGVVEGKSV